MRRILVVIALLWLVGRASAQELKPSNVTNSPDLAVSGRSDPAPSVIDNLKALVFALQTKLVAVEKELGQEKARRAELEEAELKRARETLDPSVKKALGLPVPATPPVKADEKSVTPQTPPK